jgi:hypothetical protein
MREIIGNWLASVELATAQRSQARMALVRVSSGQ